MHANLAASQPVVTPVTTVDEAHPTSGETIASLSAARTGPRRRLQRPLVRAGVVTALVLYAWSLRHTFVDDAYIQFQYARTLVHSGTWGFYAGHPSNTATSPLNVLLIAAGMIVTGSAVTASVLLTALELAVLLWLLLRLARHLFGGPFFALVAFSAIATNLLIISTFGLESLLYIVLMVAAVTMVLEQRWLSMMVAAALLTLARPDGALLALILLAATRPTPRQIMRMSGIYLATIAPWFVFSWIYLGSFVPDTLLIKIQQRAWGHSTFFNGIRLYFDRFPYETVATLALVPLCLVPFRRCSDLVRRFVSILAAYALIHFVAYSLLGVPPYHWYYIHQVAPLLLIASIGATYWSTALRRQFPPTTWLLPLLPALGLAVLLVREGLSLREAPINTNWATSATYRSVGLWLRDNLAPGTPVAVSGEIGTVAYYANQMLVNEFSDMSVADALIEHSELKHAKGVGWLFRLNFMWRGHHDPLPPPAFELVFHPGQAPGGCPPDDSACVMTWGGGTAWVHPTTIILRRREPG